MDIKFVPFRPYDSFMECCRECGSSMRPSESRVRVFNTPARAAITVPADECPDCGRLCPSQGAIEVAIAQREAMTVRPPSASRTKAMA
jgi:hypothetical protein